jgi:hypothetical protein
VVVATEQVHLGAVLIGGAAGRATSRRDGGLLGRTELELTVTWPSGGTGSFATVSWPTLISKLDV